MRADTAASLKRMRRCALDFVVRMALEIFLGMTATRGCGSAAEMRGAVRVRLRDTQELEVFLEAAAARGRGSTAEAREAMRRSLTLFSEMTAAQGCSSADEVPEVMRAGLRGAQELEVFLGRLPRADTAVSLKCAAIRVV